MHVRIGLALAVFAACSGTPGRADGAPDSMPDDGTRPALEPNAAKLASQLLE